MKPELQRALAQLTPEQRDRVQRAMDEMYSTVKDHLGMSAQDAQEAADAWGLEKARGMLPSLRHLPFALWTL